MHVYLEVVMNKNIVAVVGLGLLLAGCDYRPGGDWRDDCEVNASYDSYEYSRCVDRVSRQTEMGRASDSSGVSIDPENANRPGREDLGKGRIE